jgi:hypothetical protein
MARRGRREDRHVHARTLALRPARARPERARVATKVATEASGNGGKGGSALSAESAV